MPDATAVLSEIVTNLDALASQAVGVVAHDNTFLEAWGWNQPSVTRHEFAAEIRRPMAMIANLRTKELDDPTFRSLSLIPNQIAYIRNNAIPQLPGGNAVHVYATVKSLLEKLEALLEPLMPPRFDLEEVDARNLLPATQIKRLRQLHRTVDGLIEDAETLRSKMDLINEAHATAEALPADLRALREARQSMEAMVKAAQISQAGAETARQKAEERLPRFEELEQQAVRLVEGTENAFSAATTKGLGEEFGNRASQLSRSVWILGAVLAGTLLVGGMITYFRIQDINKLISSATFNSEVLWAHVILGIASIAPAVWLAWLVTKRIGQRFRLSEDYAFKASVAKAYAGYSQEAARIDPEFQKQLYRSALTRIDEQPLRHVEGDSHGSPIHELLGRPGLRQALLNKIQQKKDDAQSEEHSGSTS